MKRLAIFFLLTTLFCSHIFSESYANNPMFLYGKWLASVATKKWDKVVKFMGYRFNENMKQASKNYNNKEKMKLFLELHGVKNPKKNNFKNHFELIKYIFNNSTKYKNFFKDVLFPAEKISIDYYHKEKLAHYRIEDVTYFYLLDYKYVRKLKLHLKSHRIVYIQRDIRGWYVYPARF